MASTHSKYSFLGRINFEDLYNAFLGLEQRQQVFWVMGASVVSLILLVMPITCTSSRLGALEQEYEKVKKDRQEIMRKVAIYQASHAELAELQSKLGGRAGGSLTTLVESAAKELEIQPNISYLKPVKLAGNDYFDEDGLDNVELKKVSLKQVVDLLYSLKNRPDTPLKFKKVNLKAGYGRRDELTLSFTVATLKIKREQASE